MKAVKHIIDESELIKTKVVAFDNAFFKRLKETLVKLVQYICIILSYKKQLHTSVIQINILAFLSEKLALFTQM